MREPRKKTDFGMYHVVQKGINDRTLFYDNKDYEHYIEILQRVREVSKCRLFAVCLMGNHVHLLIQECEELLEVIFKRIGVAYAKYYNYKYDLRGPIFNERFWSEPVCDETYFLDTIRYICQNPVKAGLCENPFDYKWTGCGDMGGPFVLDSFKQYAEVSENQMCDFIMQPILYKHEVTERKVHLTDEKALEILSSICQNIHVTHIDECPKDQKNEILTRAIDEGISYRQLARLTGVSKGVVERACSKIHTKRFCEKK